MLVHVWACGHDVVGDEGDGSARWRILSLSPTDPVDRLSVYDLNPLPLGFTLDSLVTFLAFLVHLLHEPCILTCFKFFDSPAA